MVSGGYGLLPTLAKAIGAASTLAKAIGGLCSSVCMVVGVLALLDG